MKDKDNKLLSFRANSKWKKKVMNVDWSCGDCGINTLYNDFYIVDDNIWKQFGNKDGFLCIDCLQKRMSFKLEKSHFPKCSIGSINWEFFEISRLTKGKKIKRKCEWDKIIGKIYKEI